MPHLINKHTYKIKRKKKAYSKGPIRVADYDVAMPNGRTLSRQILEHDGAVVVIPKTRRGKYILIRQFRLAAKSWMWEWPAGGREKGEGLKRAAERELREEIGQHPKRLKKLVSFYPTPGVSEEVMHIYLAEGLRPGRGTADEDEDIEQHEFSLSEIGKMIRSGKINDAKTIIGYFYLTAGKR